MELPQSFIQAIAMHEIAYQFSSGRADIFRRHFEGFSAEDQACILTASYIDLMGSLQANGEPDLSPFFNLVQAMKNSQLIAFIESKNNSGELGDDIDQVKFSKLIGKLLKSEASIANSTDELLCQTYKECRVSEYDIEVLHDKLKLLIDSKAISEDDCKRILACFVKHGNFTRVDQERFRIVRATFGKINSLISKALSDSETSNLEIAH